MATTSSTQGTRGTDLGHAPARRLTTETKHATKTTEFFAMIAVIVGILVSAAVIKGGDTGGGADGTDEFIARQAWLYVSIVAGAYFVSRGLAKSGSREPYYADGTNSEPGDGRR
jgi:hypothetical protein